MKYIFTILLATFLGFTAASQQVVPTQSSTTDSTIYKAAIRTIVKMKTKRYIKSY